MITPKQIEAATMNPEKRASAKNDIFAFYVGRPITYLLTIPFLYTNISPNAVSWISFIPVIAGLLLFWFGNNIVFYIFGWFAFFLWSMLDGVDGNIARYKKQFSKMGDTLDAAVGYYAMALIPLAGGIAAAHNPGFISEMLGLHSDVYIMLGALSGFWVVLPRLIMHKGINSTGQKNIGGVKDKKSFSLPKIIALNITSVPGLVQILLLVSVFFTTYDIYTLGYFVVNTLVMLMSLRSIFKEK